MWTVYIEFNDLILRSTFSFKSAINIVASIVQILAFHSVSLIIKIFTNLNFTILLIFILSGDTDTNSGPTIHFNKKNRRVLQYMLMLWTI